MIGNTKSAIPEESLSENRHRSGLQADLCTLIGTLASAMIAVYGLMPGRFDGRFRTDRRG
jgi:hypothetical protein